MILLVLDANASATEKDRVLAQKASNNGHTCIIVSNKWDAVLYKETYIILRVIPTANAKRRA